MNTKKISIYSFLFCFLSNFIVQNSYTNPLCYLALNSEADKIAWAVNPLNDKIAIAFTDGTVHLFNLNSGKCISILKVARPFNYNLLFVNHLRRLGSISDKEKQEIFASSPHDIINDIYWHKDGQSIFISISKSDQNKGNLDDNDFWEQWDIETGKILNVCDKEESHSYTPWPGERHMHKFNIHKNLYFVFDEPQTITIYSAKHNNNTVALPFYTPNYEGKVWGYFEIGYTPLKKIHLSEPANHVYWDTEEKNLIVTSNNGIFLLDIETELMSLFSLQGGGRLWFSPNGNKIAANGYNKSIDILDASDARHITTINNAYMLCFNLNGTKVIFSEGTTDRVGIYNLAD